MKLFNIFKSPTTEDIIEQIFKSEDFKELIAFQVAELARHKRIERKDTIREKYGYYKHRLDLGDVLKAEKYDEWLYVKYIVEETYSN